MHLLPQYLPPVLLENSVLGQMEQVRSTAQQQREKKTHQQSNSSSSEEKVNLVVNVKGSS
jgi:hypothetical protein